MSNITLDEVLKDFIKVTEYDRVKREREIQRKKDDAYIASILVGFRPVKEVSKVW